LFSYTQLRVKLLTAAARLRARRCLAIAEARRSPIPCQTLLPAGAIGAGVTSLAVIAEGTAGIASRGLLSVAARRVPLYLAQVAGTILILAKSAAVLLIHSRPILLIQARLMGGAWLQPIVLRQVLPAILILGLIKLLVEMRSAEVSAASIAVEIISAVIVRVDGITVEIVAIDVGGIDVVHVHVAVVIVIAIDESIGCGDVGVVVIDYSRVVPSASPGVPTPSAAPSVANRGADSQPHPE
jgi:hypothetical protein